MSYLDDVNKVAVSMLPKMVEEMLNKPSPILDFLKRNDLESVYARAKKYGYKKPYKNRWEGYR